MWLESGGDEQKLIATMSDAVFRIDCPRLRVDHAAALARAVCTKVPHLNESPRAGIHPIHVAGSQNGWERPEDSNEYLLLSKRTRFRIRVETAKAEALIKLLEGETLDIDGLALKILSGQTRTISPSTTLFSRYAYFDEENVDKEKLDDKRFYKEKTEDNEERFVQRVINQCHTHGFIPTKILCGRTHTVMGDNAPQPMRSVLLADVPAAASVIMQDNGIGDGRTMGCGLLIPHKDTAAVNEATDVELHQ